MYSKHIIGTLSFSDSNFIHNESNNNPHNRGHTI